MHRHDRHIRKAHPRIQRRNLIERRSRPHIEGGDRDVGVEVPAEDHLLVKAPDLEQVVAQETIDIYAPIANRLGISWVKVELEDLSFRY